MIHALLIKYLKETMASCKRILLTPVHRDKLVSMFRFDVTKEEINKCNIQSFNDKVYVINTEHDEHLPENKEAIEKLLNADVIGFDTETRVIFSRPEIQPPMSLIQLATEDVVVLWRLRKQNRFLRKEFPPLLKNILQNNNIKKVGSGNNNDLKELYEQYQITVCSLFDTQNIAKQLGFIKLGLASMSAQLFGWRIAKNKRITCSNWEAAVLDKRQIAYAANDAWAALLVYNKLNSVMEEVGITPVPSPSVFETVLHQESKTDHKLFHKIDGKLCGSSNAKHESKKKKRKKRKFDCAMFDLGLDCHSELLSKEARIDNSYVNNNRNSSGDTCYNVNDQNSNQTSPYIYQPSRVNNSNNSLYESSHSFPYIYRSIPAHVDNSSVNYDRYLSPDTLSVNYDRYLRPSSSHSLHSPYMYQTFPKPI